MNEYPDSNKASLLKVQTLIKHLHDGIVVHAPDTSILMANEEASRILGLTIEQMQGRAAIDPSWSFLREDGSVLPLEEYPVMRALNTRQSFTNCVLGRKNAVNGAYIWARVEAFPEFDEKGELSHVVVTFVEITREIETKKALAESEETFAKFFHYSPGIMIVTKIEDGCIVETNNKIFRAGYERNELIGKSILDLDFWVDLTARSHFYNEIYGSGKIENFETKFKNKSGEIFTCLISGEKITFRNAPCIISVLIDISDRKKAENEMNVLFEIVQGVVNTSDLSELLKIIHQSLKKLLYAENCFFALHDGNTGLFSFPYFVDQYDQAFQPQELYKSCTSYVYETGKSILITPKVFQQLVDADKVELVGSPSPSWIGVPLKTSSRTIGVLVLQHYSEENIYKEEHLNFLDSIGSQVANVIERKRAENELEISHSLIAATLESTADGILVVDKFGKITSYNSKFAELWRIPDSILQKYDDETLLCYVLDQLKDPESFMKKVKEIYYNDEEVTTDYLTFKDGKIFERYSQSQVFNGKSVGRVWSFRNITEQKKTLKALHQSETRFRELNATKDKFFSIIAHDLKSPFNGILGFSNLLTEQIKAKDYDGIEEYAEIIQYSSQKAIDLLMNLMEWSRSQSGRMDFHAESIEIGALIGEVHELAKIAAVQKSIQFTTVQAHPMVVQLDKEMISSVLRNLISNAIKFTHPGGRIEVKAEQLKEELLVTVSDNGIGIEKKELAKLFRIDESYSLPGTHNEKGTGLGLVLCKEFIDKHNGTIWAESEPGKGSRFCFKIPVQPT